MSDETGTANRDRAMVLTAPGAAAIAVIRIIGDGVEEFLSKYFSRSLTPLRCTHGELSDNDRVIDDPVIVLHENRKSADINLHGGPWVVQACLDLLRRESFEIVESRDGQVALDATDGSDRIEREMLAHLPLATTELALRALLAQPKLWRDFQSSNPSPEAIQLVLEDRALWWLLHPPTLAIIGAANVGKSTLANQLFAQQRSITADLPGTTRDWVGALANIDGLAVTLIDTPGVRETSDEIERAAIESASHRARSADLTILVLDISRSLDDQRELLDGYPSARRVANKCDLIAKWDPGEFLTISASHNTNVDRLRSMIRADFGCEEFDETRPRWWSIRQRDELRKM